MRSDFTDRRGGRLVALSDFRRFRRTWSRPAAYRLTLARHGTPAAALAAAAWLAAHRIPVSGRP